MAQSLPPSRFWAKYDQRTGDWHPLVAHSADVAAVLARMLGPDSLLAARLARTAGLERLGPGAAAALTYLAVLHDLGKANHGFQEKILPRERRRGWPADGHVGVVLDSLGGCRPIQTLVREIIAPLGGDSHEMLGLFAAAICHHGRPHGEHERSTPLHRLWDPTERPGWDPLDMIRRLVGHARAWSGVEELGTIDHVPTTPAFTHLFAGALTLADWIGSTRSAFEFAPWADDDPNRYWELARQRAAAACAQIGVVPETRVTVHPGADLLTQIFPRVFTKHEPTPLQRRIAEMPLPLPGARLLIESETGSGKTEAALALYARLRAQDRVGGLVFALPTRATAAAMHRRILEALPGVYAPGSGPTVALAMGGRHVRADTNAPLVAEDPVTHPDRSDSELARWSSSSAKKFFAAEIVVGTIDQVLLGGLLVRHAHLRLAALSRHLLVVDEIHSCDRYMAEILARIVNFHTRAGGIAVFMSATLSDVERRRFSGGSQSEPEIEDCIRRPYPVLSTCEGPGSKWRDEALPDLDSFTRAKSVTWQACGEANGLAAAVDAARLGARVCVLRNTVKDARATIDALRDLGAAELLWRPAGSRYTPSYHSRYTVPDRLALDEAVLARFGLHGPDAGTILVATQVAEQSLDIDFDLLVTDLCPIDVLLQRIGRLHRHPRRRPEPYRAAQALIIAPDQGLENLIGGDRAVGPHGWGPVYEDLGDLELTLRLITDPARNTIEIPRHSRELIERVYHAAPREALAAESERWQRAFIVNEGKNLGREVRAAGATIDFEQGYAENGERFTASAERSLRTRLGDDRIRIELPLPVPCFHADPTRYPPVTTVDLPEYLLAPYDAGGEQPGITDMMVTEEEVRFTVNGKGPIRYDWHGWHWPSSPRPHAK